MPARVSEAIVLQTYPLKESDLIVSFFTRDAGKLRGVAKRARRPKSLFGSGLERLSQVRMAYFERENRELVNVDSCDLLQSQFALLSDYAAGVALDYIAEISEQMLPPHEPNEKYFRLILTVLEHIRSGGTGAVWRGATYFTLWAVRIAGLLPEMHACAGCGAWLDDPEAPARAFFRRGVNGLLCVDCKRVSVNPRDAWELSTQAREIAGQMRRWPVGEITGEWTRETAADLRRFLQQQIESHIERRLITVPVLEAA
jgi:DNA repair protein RecO (recombination protein O)